MRLAAAITLAMVALVSTNDRGRAEGVGFTHLVAETRPGGFQRIAVWFPNADGAPSQWRVGSQIMHVTAADDLTPGRHGLVVIVHAVATTALSHSDTAIALAGNGYIVAAPVISDDGGHGVDADAGRHILRRIETARVAIDALVSDATFSPHIDATRIGIIGHGHGGAAVLALLGSRPQRLGPVRHCRQFPKDVICKAEGVSSIGAASDERIDGTPDPRIRAAFVMSPTPLWYRGEQLQGMRHPLTVVVAEKDEVIKDQGAARRLATATRDVSFSVVPNAGHYAFVTPPSAINKDVSAAVLADPYGFDRRAYLKSLGRDVVAFFGAALMRSTPSHHQRQ